jgi:hypothetical protein
MPAPSSEARVPRPFEMHWGSGQIIEEARFEGAHTAPAIQLMRYDDGEAAGTLMLRFCHFSHDGRFQRSPMMISESEIDQLRTAVAQSPEIRRLLLRIAGAKR